MGAMLEQVCHAMERPADRLWADAGQQQVDSDAQEARYMRQPLRSKLTETVFEGGDCQHEHLGPVQRRQSLAPDLLADSQYAESM